MQTLISSSSFASFRNSEKHRFFGFASFGNTSRFSRQEEEEEITSFQPHQAD